MNKKRAATKKKASDKTEKLTRKIYDEELARLHGELVKLQQWVVSKGLKVCVIFEGRDAAGKGGVINTILTPLNIIPTK